MSQWPVEARSLACPDAEIRHCWLCSASYLFNFFDDSYRANYLKIYQTDLCQIFRVGRTVAVDDQSQISFFVPQGTLPWQPFLFILLTFSSCQWLVAQLDRLKLGFGLHLVNLLLVLQNMTVLLFACYMHYILFCDV